MVVDPVLTSSSGTELLEPRATDQLVDQLLPLVALATPNARELRVLGPLPCRTLVTGGDEGGAEVVDNLYRPGGELEHTWRHPRLPGAVHGSGCALSSAIAVAFARGASPMTACDHGIAFARTLFGT